MLEDKKRAKQTLQLGTTIRVDTLSYLETNSLRCRAGHFPRPYIVDASRLSAPQWLCIRTSCPFTAQALQQHIHSVWTSESPAPLRRCNSKQRQRMNSARIGRSARRPGRLAKNSLLPHRRVALEPLGSRESGGAQHNSVSLSLSLALTRTIFIMR